MSNFTCTRYAYTVMSDDDEVMATSHVLGRDEADAVRQVRLVHGNYRVELNVSSFQGSE